jgi:glycine cleavage system H protein
MPAETRYTENEEWVSVDGDTATVGITTYAQEQLGDLVYVKLPKVGQHVVKGKEAAAVESVKAAYDVYAPVTGDVIEVNAALGSEPGLVNSDAMGAGWFFRVRIASPDELKDLMDESQYRDFHNKQ